MSDDYRTYLTYGADAVLNIAGPIELITSNDGQMLRVVLTHGQLKNLAQDAVAAAIRKERRDATIKII